MFYLLYLYYADVAQDYPLLNLVQYQTVRVALAMATAMIVALGAQGSFVAINNTVSQSVPHLHLHVVPRTKGDGLRGFFWPRTKYAADESGTYAERLRAALE